MTLAFVGFSHGEANAYILLDEGILHTILKLRSLLLRFLHTRATFGGALRGMSVVKRLYCHWSRSRNQLVNSAWKSWVSEVHEL